MDQKKCLYKEVPQQLHVHRLTQKPIVPSQLCLWFTYAVQRIVKVGKDLEDHQVQPASHQLSIFSILMVGRGSRLVMTAVLATFFVYTDQERVKRDQLSPTFFFFFLNQYLQAETKGEIFVCGGTAERGEFVHKTHNETSYWLEQCCDTAIAVQYRGVTIINRKILPPHFLLQVRSRPEKAGILKCDWTVPPL